MTKTNHKRLELIDTLRGITIISMILYHTCWFACFFNLFISPELMYSSAFNIWERTICISFIFISGFSYSLGKHPVKRGFFTLLIGIAITIVSLIFVYDIRDVFGVLWILGLSPIVMAVIEKIIPKIRRRTIYQVIFTVVMIFCFLLTYEQMSFITDDRKDKMKKLDTAMDSIRTRFGDASVKRASTIDIDGRINRRHKAERK